MQPGLDKVFSFGSYSGRIWNKYSGLPKWHSNDRSLHRRKPRERILGWHQFCNLYIYSKYSFRLAWMDASHRQQCAAAEALTLLEGRISSVLSDRSATMVNICNYETRKNSTVLEQPDSSCSAYALVLPVLSGDMSLLADFLESAPSYKHKRAACRSARSLFYWDDDYVHRPMPTGFHGIQGLQCLWAIPSVLMKLTAGSAWCPQLSSTNGLKVWRYSCGK